MIRNLLADKLKSNLQNVQEWFRTQSLKHPTPFYSSVDLRDSGHKIAAIDCNLFPAGFNNICEKDQFSASAIFKEILSPHQKILIIPESHTKNTYYIENLYQLYLILKNAGLDVKIGWYPNDENQNESIELKSYLDNTLTAHPIEIKDHLVQIQNWVADAIVLNNDFSGGYPKLFDQVTQPILPSHRLGWHTRKKSVHFEKYNQLAKELSLLIGIDPWHLQVKTIEVKDVDFNEGVGLDQVAKATEEILTHIKEQYQKNGVDLKPTVFIKSNSGTYGMGIQTVHSAEEVLSLNRRKKNKLSIGKDRTEIHSVIVQEGIPTATIINKFPAEPVIYLAQCKLIGGFLRTNTKRGTDENLNSQGMVFKKLCMSDLNAIIEDAEPQSAPELELVYGTIARLASLAAGQEIASY